MVSDQDARANAWQPRRVSPSSISATGSASCALTSLPKRRSPCRGPSQSPSLRDGLKSSCCGRSGNQASAATEAGKSLIAGSGNADSYSRNSHRSSREPTLFSGPAASRRGPGRRRRPQDRHGLGRPQDDGYTDTWRPRDAGAPGMAPRSASRLARRHCTGGRLAHDVWPVPGHPRSGHTRAIGTRGGASRTSTNTFVSKPSKACASSRIGPRSWSAGRSSRCCCICARKSTTVGGVGGPA